MKNKWFQKVLCMMLSVTLLLTSMGFSVSAASLKDDPNAENPYVETTLEDMQKLVGTLPYAEYSAANAGMQAGSKVLAIDITNFNKGDTSTGVTLSGESDVVKQAIEDAKAAGNGNWNGFTLEEYGDSTVYLPATGSVTWDIDVSKDDVGLYFIKFEYYSCITPESSVSAIERSFRINGRAPFDEVSSISLSKNWAYLV